MSGGDVEPIAPGGGGIPAWVPEGVRLRAEHMWASLAEPGQAIPSWMGNVPGFVRMKRILCDPRMENVWRELQRTRRSGGGFINPAWGRAGFGDEVQQEGMVWLFTLLVGNLHPGLTVRIQTEIELEKSRFLDHLTNLRAIATDIYRIAPLRAKAIEGEADALAIEIESAFGGRTANHSDALTVQRQRGDSHVRACVIQAVNACRQCFGSPLYSTVATITNVALDRIDITESKVRAIVRDK